MSATTVSGRFEDKTIVVTGAGSGIGLAVAKRIIAEGGRVVASDMSAERLDELAAEANTDRLITVVSNVTVQEDIDKIVAAAAGKIDGLANNAGIMDGFVPLHELTDDLWDMVMNVNVTGAMRMARAVLPFMIEQKRGAIVNTASAAGMRGGAAGTAYTTSKHAVVGMTRSASVLYAKDGIRVNAVAPGGVATNIDGQMKSDFAVERLAPLFSTLQVGPASAETLAASITWLLSDDSDNVNGLILASDGGWAAQ